MAEGSARDRWRRIFRSDERSEIEDELAFHLERRESDYVARGMDRESAHRAARTRLGDLTGVRSECASLLTAERRAERRREWLRFSWLDVKLGARLLRRYPGLTAVGGLAMAFAIAVGAGAFEVVQQLVDPRLPLEGGDRLVAIRHVDAAAARVTQPGVQDFLEWREQLEAVEDLGAYRTLDRNLWVGEGLPEPVSVAETSASAFRVAPVTPLLGRTLLTADEGAGAPPVIVLGHEVWQRRFGGDAGVVGRIVHLDGVSTTVVGVMPEGFAFPVAHRAWTPLRLPVPGEARADERAVQVFGRLARGATVAKAQAELAALGARAAAEHAATHAQLRPEVVQYAQSVVMLDVPPAFRRAFYAVNVFFVLLLLLVCANIALLMYARAATRESEIVVRTALGASRRRIVGQLFVEALVLGGIASVVGLIAARFAVGALFGVFQAESGGQLPFWLVPRIAPLTLAYTVGLALLGAAVAGVVPALRMTGAGVEARLRQLAGLGRGPQFGRLWTLVIIAQIAVAVALPATAFFVQRSISQVRSVQMAFAPEQFLSARLDMHTEGGAAAAFPTLARSLMAEPAVRGVTYADRLPRTHHPAYRMQVEDDEAPAGGDDAVARVSVARVDPGFFDILGVRIESGRGFGAADTVDGGTAIVNSSFVDRVLAGRNAVGRRVRYAGPAGAEPGPWYEIVGVVGDLGMMDDVSGGVGLYHPTPLSQVGPLHVIVHAGTAPESIVAPLRSAAAAADPSLRLHDVMPLQEVGSALWLEFAFLFKLLIGVSAVALLLSLAGIYAITSFTVARRTREIGIRVALGVDARRLVATIFARPVAHVGTGVVIGAALAAALAWGVMGGAPGGKGGLVLAVASYAALMLAVCLLGCVVPLRRALSVEPIEALRADT